MTFQQITVKMELVSSSTARRSQREVEILVSNMTSRDHKHKQLYLIYDHIYYQCSICGSDKTRVNKYGYEQWNIGKEERIIRKIKQAENNIHPAHNRAYIETQRELGPGLS